MGFCLGGIIGWRAFVPLVAVQVETIRGLFDVELLDILKGLDDLWVSFGEWFLYLGTSC